MQYQLQAQQLEIVPQNPVPEHVQLIVKRYVVYNIDKQQTFTMLLHQGRPLIG